MSNIVRLDFQKGEHKYSFYYDNVDDLFKHFIDMALDKNIGLNREDLIPLSKKLMDYISLEDLG